jgi:hypothetical protein
MAPYLKSDELQKCIAKQVEASEKGVVHNYNFEYYYSIMKQVGFKLVYKPFMYQIVIEQGEGS